MRPSWCLLLPLSLGCACLATPPRPPLEMAEQGRLSRSLENQTRFLRISFFVTPFFGDESKQLLSPTHPDWLHLLEDTDGNPVSPGDVEAVLPAGTLVRILKVEFPSTWALQERVLYSPRSRPWVYVTTQHASKPLILVLNNNFKDTKDFLAELNRYVTPLNPSIFMAELSVDEQSAIRTKEALVGMGAEALEMALGYPESKTILFEGEQKTETWVWGGGKKTVTLRAGRVQ